MARCRKCGGEVCGRSICRGCLRKWTDMRAIAFGYVQNKHGKMCADNLKVIQKEMKGLDRLWKRDPDKFYAKVEPKEKGEA